MNNSVTKSRIGAIDIVKGLAILGVCWAHIAGTVLPLYLILFPQVLGTFFMISGYFYKEERGYFTYVKQRTRQILLPALGFSAIVLLIFFIFEKIMGNTEITFLELPKVWFKQILDPTAFLPMGSCDNDFQKTATAIQMMISPVWFLYRTFISELIFFAVGKWALKSTKRAIVTIIGFVSITALLQTVLPIYLPFQLETCFLVTALMLIGALAKKLNIMDYICSECKNARYWLVFAGAAIIFFALVAMGLSGSMFAFGRYTLLSQSKSWYAFPWTIFCLTGSYWLLVVGALLERAKFIGTAVKAMGTHSLFILCFHTIIAHMVVRCVGSSLPVYDTTSRSPWLLVLMLAAIAICIGIDVVKEKIKRILK